MCLTRSSRLSLLGTGFICRYSPLLLLSFRCRGGCGSSPSMRSGVGVVVSEDSDGKLGALLPRVLILCFGSRLVFPGGVVLYICTGWIGFVSVCIYIFWILLYSSTFSQSHPVLGWVVYILLPLYVYVSCLLISLLASVLWPFACARGCATLGLSTPVGCRRHQGLVGGS